MFYQYSVGSPDQVFCVHIYRCEAMILATKDQLAVIH
jgi:hypothetical protein